MPDWAALGAESGPLLLLAAFGLGALLATLVTEVWHQVRLARERTRTAVLQAELRTQAELETERERLLRSASDSLAVSFERLASRSLRSQSEVMMNLAQAHLERHQAQAEQSYKERQQAVEALVGPIEEMLARTHTQVERLENERRAAQGSIQQHLQSVVTSQRELQSETRNLVNALRRPEVRGQWGEMTLRRVVELAGMVEHCDFVAQAHVSGREGNLRPDMVIRLPDAHSLVIDVKTPMDAYLEALEAQAEEDRRAALLRHSRNLKERVRELADKAYWRQFEESPEFVVLFVPGDQFLAAALDVAPGLQEEAMRQRVLIATPTSLIGLLKVIAHGWRQVSFARNAEVLCGLSEDLYRRLGNFVDHLAKLGRSLDGSVAAYNRAVGSLERQVLPSARRFTEMGVSPGREIPELDQLEVGVRTATGPTESASGEIEATQASGRSGPSR